MVKPFKIFFGTELSLKPDIHRKVFGYICINSFHISKHEMAAKACGDDWW